MTLEIQFLVWERYIDCDGVKSANGVSTPPSNNWISNGNKDGSERVIMAYADFSEREITDFDIIHIYIHHAKNKLPKLCNNL